MSYIYNCIRGYGRYSVSASASSRVFDMLIKEDIPFSVKSSDGAECVYIVPSAYVKRHEEILTRLKRGKSGGGRGIPYYIKKYRLRAGMFAGAVIAVFLTAISSFFVWDINIKGNSLVSDAEILDMLGEYGLYTGCWIPGTDNVKISRQAVLSDGRISWMSINMRGTVANVEVRETDGENKIIGTQPSNLVAKYDGVVVSATITGGVKYVKPGDIVKKGDLLAGGIIQSAALGYRLTRSGGTVTARVQAKSEAEIAFSATQKVYTGREHSEKSIKFFSLDINLSGKHGIPINKEYVNRRSKRICLFSAVELPIYVNETLYREYGYEERTLSYSEALAAADKKINGDFSAYIENGEVLSYETEIIQTETSVKVKKTLLCVTDITSEIPITLK